jgi:hypothetical protein
MARAGTIRIGISGRTYGMLHPDAFSDWAEPRNDNLV